MASAEWLDCGEIRMRCAGLVPFAQNARVRQVVKKPVRKDAAGAEVVGHAGEIPMVAIAKGKHPAFELKKRRYYDLIFETPHGFEGMRGVY